MVYLYMIKVFYSYTCQYVVLILFHSRFILYEYGIFDSITRHIQGGFFDPLVLVFGLKNSPTTSLGFFLFLFFYAIIFIQQYKYLDMVLWSLFGRQFPHAR